MPHFVKRLLLTLFIAFIVVLLVTIGGGLWFYQTLRSSLPILDGVQSLPRLTASVTIDRDGLGVPTITADNWNDLTMATGFVHSQDRFFQMDLSRRQAAGELAAIFGSIALPLDKKMRTHQFRSRALQVLNTMPPQEKSTIEAYTVGVNAGLNALKAKPFEYLLLRVDPEPWRPEDSILVIHSMFLELQDETGSYESKQGLLHDLLPPDLSSFLVPKGTSWDTPLIGDAIQMPHTPGAKTVDLRDHRFWPVRDRNDNKYTHNLPVGGSNSWAISGEHTASGDTLLANDMHLNNSVPHIWYRVSLKWKSDHGHPHRVTGVSLPGLPSVIVGSNEHVAWGFTNTHGDWSDLVVLEIEDPNTYRTPNGLKEFERTIERITVKDQADELFEVVSTIWGPVIDEDHRGRPRALIWVAHQADGVNLRTMNFNTAHTVEQLLDIANDAGIPAQNLLVVDRDGHLAWSIAGKIPWRFGFSGQRPTSWSSETRGWNGWLPLAQYPRVVDPTEGRLWSANNRHVSGKSLEIIGDEGYDVGARARQIRDDLRLLHRATPNDMLAIQLDDRALFLNRWRDLLLELLTPFALRGETRRAELQQFVLKDWDGRASVSSVGYRAVRTFRDVLANMVLNPLTAPCVEVDEQCDISKSRNSEGPLWQLIQERPRHLLNPSYHTWNDQLLKAVDKTIEILMDDKNSLAEITWGTRNAVTFRHPLSQAIPLLGRWLRLDMPVKHLPGDDNMPRFQSPTASASQRMAVSPGREVEGYFHMPVGQSGHPLSPHYRDGHSAWVHGDPTPFLPGSTIHKLVLKPKLNMK